KLCLSGAWERRFRDSRVQRVRCCRFHCQSDSLNWAASRETTMAMKASKPVRASRRAFSSEFRREAVRMMLNGHSAASIAERLGLAGTNLLYRWKREELDRTGPVATSLEGRIRELEIELHRIERERDILKKALAIFGR